MPDTIAITTVGMTLVDACKVAFLVQLPRLPINPRPCHLLPPPSPGVSRVLLHCSLVHVANTDYVGARYDQLIHADQDHVVFLPGALVEVSVTKSHVLEVMFADDLALHVLGPPDPPLVQSRPHLHLRKCDYRLVVLHHLCPLLCIFFDTAEATWTVVLQ